MGIRRVYTKLTKDAARRTMATMMRAYDDGVLNPESAAIEKPTTTRQAPPITRTLGRSISQVLCLR